jgi:hypothetical protein
MVEKEACLLIWGAREVHGRLVIEPPARKTHFFSYLDGRPVNLLSRLEQRIDIAGREAGAIAEDHGRTAEDVDLADGTVSRQKLGQAV